MFQTLNSGTATLTVTVLSLFQNLFLMFGAEVDLSFYFIIMTCACIQDWRRGVVFPTLNTQKAGTLNVQFVSNMSKLVRRGVGQHACSSSELDRCDISAPARAQSDRSITYAG